MCCPPCCQSQGQGCPWCFSRKATSPWRCEASILSWPNLWAAQRNNQQRNKQALFTARTWVREADYNVGHFCGSHTGPGEGCFVMSGLGHWLMVKTPLPCGFSGYRHPQNQWDFFLLGQSFLIKGLHGLWTLWRGYITLWPCLKGILRSHWQTIPTHKAGQCPVS